MTVVGCWIQSLTNVDCAREANWLAPGFISPISSAVLLSKVRAVYIITIRRSSPYRVNFKSNTNSTGGAEENSMMLSSSYSHSTTLYMLQLPTSLCRRIMPDCIQWFSMLSIACRSRAVPLFPLSPLGDVSRRTKKEVYSSEHAGQQNQRRRGRVIELSFRATGGNIPELVNRGVVCGLQY